MDIYTLPDKTIQKELGNRFRAMRLRRNATQQELASATRLSLNVIKALESGKGKLSSIIAVLRQLQALEQLHNFIPEPVVSPLQIAKMKGKTRKRATGKRKGARQAVTETDTGSDNRPKDASESADEQAANSPIPPPDEAEVQVEPAAPEEEPVEPAEESIEVEEESVEAEEESVEAEEESIEAEEGPPWSEEESAGPEVEPVEAEEESVEGEEGPPWSKEESAGPEVEPGEPEEEPVLPDDPAESGPGRTEVETADSDSGPEAEENRHRKAEDPQKDFGW